MKNILIGIVLVMIIYVEFDSRKTKTYWKERYNDAQVWADTLYEENLILHDSIRKLKSDTIFIY